MAEEWGPWIKHDGRSKPRDGLYVQREYFSGVVLEGVMGRDTWRSTSLGLPKYHGQTFSSSWLWDKPGSYVPVARYRIRRPSALRRLIDLAADPEKGLPPRFPVEELA